MKTIAVLGAGGFLGRSLCERLTKTNHALILGSLKPGAYDGISIEPVDLTQSDSLARWLNGRKPDVLFYLSSLLPYRYPGRDRELLQGNLVMHQNVFELWTRQRFHLIYASGTTVYAPTDRTLTESSPTMPQSFYTVSKLWGENLFWLGHSNQGLPLSILRISAPYGHKIENPTVVNAFFNKAVTNIDLELMGSGRRQQDFIYVKDVAEGLFSTFAKRKYGVFNIAGGKTVNMKQLAQAVIRATGSRSRIVFTGKPDPQEGIRVKVSVTKARKELGFTCKYSLHDGLKDMFRIYRRGMLSR